MEQAKVFLEGPAGTGKTTWGRERLSALLERSSEKVMVLVPQKILADQYLDVIQNKNGVFADIFTIGSLSRSMVEMYWPIISGPAGFAEPTKLPTFLNLEGAQYFMAYVLRPLFGEGYFESVTITRNRLYTQILDNLNKAALNGYQLDEIGGRLELANVGDPEQQRIYKDAQLAATKFREFCLEHNFVDFSLQVALFGEFLWSRDGLCQDYLRESYRHLIVDNLEETTPIEHDLIRSWLPDLDSALLIYDTEAGYRRFLGADPDSAYSLKAEINQHLVMDDSFVTPPVLQIVGNRIGKILNRKTVLRPEMLTLPDVQEGIVVESHRYFPEMLDWVAEQVAYLVNELGVPPAEIAVLSPFLSDALRYSLAEKLEKWGINTRSHRPSRSLRDEPVSQALVTLAKIGHPDWGFTPSHFDLAYLFIQSIEGMDLVRAQLLAEEVLHYANGQPKLLSFSQLKPGVQERITFLLGERYDALRLWINDYIESGNDELDFFLGRIFGELLAQPGYGFHNRYDAGEIAANLIDSIKHFRRATDTGLFSSQMRGKEYIQMVQEGVIAAQYLRSWRTEDTEAVQLLPAYTFLMQNRAVDFQFWLDIGSYGWHKRIYQPITHPYVLNRNWPKDRYWTDFDEVETEQESMYRLVMGLLRRCRSQIYLGLSDLSESGYESEGLLLKTLHRFYQQVVAEG
ncbi:hypothetical protein KQH54_03135 [bacterium]|nr:hypothetical protein [bacterium]